MKELEDFNWFPKALRRYQTDYIGFVVAHFGIYSAFIDYLKTANTNTGTMFDLCSGSGEPAISIFKKSGKFKSLVLSDKFPQAYANSGHITYIKSGCDVLTMKFDPGHTNTMFNAFHHFDDKQKSSIIERIRQAGSGAFFVEILQPTILTFFKVLFATTLGTLLLAPFLKPFSLTRLFFTYIIPVNLLTITFDGLVSVFKSRTVKQYREIFGHSPDIKVFTLNNGLSPLTVIQLQTS